VSKSLERTIDALAEYSQSPVKRVGTGLNLIDVTIGGPSPGELGLIVGRSFTGKSIVAQNIILNNPQVPSIFFSLEMPAIQAAIRLFSMWANVDVRKVQRAIDTGMLPDNIYEVVSAFPHHKIVDTSALTLERMTDHLQQYEEEFDERPHLAVIDYLELVGRDRTSDTGQGVENTVVAMKDWAKVNNISVWAVHQGNMSTKIWEPPTEDSPRYAGMAQADFLLGIWRPHRDPELPESERRYLQDKFALNVLKNRAYFESIDKVIYTIAPSLRLWEQNARPTTSDLQVSGEQSWTDTTAESGESLGDWNF
jgi:replicative DNA helicase